MSVFVVCEAGVTNYGDPDLARRQIDVAVEAGADAVKFQAWDTPSLVSRHAANARRGDLGYDWFERMEERRLDWDALRELQRYARERGITWYATPHDERALRFLVDVLDVPMLKVGSGEAGNLAFLQLVGGAERSVQIAFGLQSDDEAARAVAELLAGGATDVIAFHTVSVYPTPASLAWLTRVDRLRELLGIPVGISDHTVGWHVPLAAVARGADAVEKHLTFDRADPRSLDNPGALEPTEFTEMVRQIREVEEALETPEPAALADAVAVARAWATQAVVAARDLAAGMELAPSDVEFKRPALGGVPAGEVGSLLGRRLVRAVVADEQIRREDVR